MDTSCTTTSVFNMDAEYEPIKILGRFQLPSYSKTTSTGTSGELCDGFIVRCVETATGTTTNTLTCQATKDGKIYAEKVKSLGYRGTFFSVNTVTVNSTSEKKIEINTASRPHNITFSLTPLLTPKPIVNPVKPNQAPIRQSQPLLNGALVFRKTQDPTVSSGKLQAGKQTLICTLNTAALDCTIEIGLTTVIMADYSLPLALGDQIKSLESIQKNELDLPTIKATIKNPSAPETSITHTLRPTKRSGLN